MPDRSTWQALTAGEEELQARAEAHRSSTAIASVAIGCGALALWPTDLALDPGAARTTLALRALMLVAGAVPPLTALGTTRRRALAAAALATLVAWELAWFAVLAQLRGGLHTRAGELALLQLAGLVLLQGASPRVALAWTLLAAALPHALGALLPSAGFRPGPYALVAWPAAALAAAVHLALARASSAQVAAQRALHRAALTDRLTDAWNRQYFEDVAPRELSRSRRYRQPVSLLLLDIDGFRRVNEAHGHAAGDDVLRAVAAAVRSRIRAPDLLVRWTGAQLLVLAPSTRSAGAVDLAENLRRAVEALEVPTVGKVTVSAGVAEHEDEPLVRWVQRADEALVVAKGSGRNRVVAAAPSPRPLPAEPAVAAHVHLAWRDAYASGDATLDAEHREIFELSNALLDLYGKGAGRAALGEAIDRLLDRVERHFCEEERRLVAAGYPGVEAHRDAHQNLLRHAQERRDEHARGELAFVAMVHFLVDEVVTRHILNADREYRDWLTGAAAPGGDG